MDVALIIPALNEEESLIELVDWIRKVMTTTDLTYEVWFIDDGSTDSTWEVIESLHHLYPSIKGIKFRRNYGKSAALNTGFHVCNADVVITMDADLQDSPEEIPELYRMIKEEKFDVVSGWKKAV